MSFNVILYEKLRFYGENINIHDTNIGKDQSMKKLFGMISIALCLILVALPLTACKKEKEGDTTTIAQTTAKPKSGLAIDKDKLVLAVGQTDTLQVTNLATGEATLAVIWSSDNESIARVDTAGKVTALSEGDAVITATTIDNKYTVKCNVTVSASVVGLTLTEQLSLNIGQNSKLTADTVPSGLTVPLKWQSTVESVATVDEDGNVTGLMSGTSSIIVSTLDGKYMAACTVTVMNPVASITFDESTVKLNVGVSKKLIYTVIPADATDQKFTFESSNSNVAAVSEGGVVTAVSAGTATIKCTAPNGVTASCTVQITVALSSIVLDNSELIVNIGETSKLVATFEPENATVTEIVWQTSDPKIVGVDQNGNLTAVGVGEAIISASTPDGELTASCIVTVIDPSVSIGFESTDITLKLGSEVDDHITLIPIVTPENPNETFTWSSSNDKIVSVSASGIIRAKELGTAVITVKCSSGAVASVNVTVEKAPIVIPIESVEISSPSESGGIVTVTEGQYIDINVTFTPSNATDKEYSFKITGSAVKEKDGKLYALKEGAATVKIIAKNNGKEVSSNNIVISVNALGNTDKERIIAEYNTKLSAENDLNTANKAAINAKYVIETSSKDLKNSIGTAEGDVAAAKAVLEVYEKQLGDAQGSDEKERLQSLVDSSKAEVKKLEDELESKKALYNSTLALEQAKESELAAEKERHNGVINKLESDYDYILRYL